jgi:hypothetical protein
MMVLDDDRETGGSLWSAGDAAAVVRRIWYALPAVGALLVVGTLTWGSSQDVVGVLVGVVLAAVNFRFLETSLRSLLGAGYERAPSGTTLMLIVRWALVAMLGFAAHRSGTASGGGILLGLFAPAMAILLEALYQLIAAYARPDGD